MAGHDALQVFMFYIMKCDYIRQSETLYILYMMPSLGLIYHDSRNFLGRISESKFANLRF